MQQRGSELARRRCVAAFGQLLQGHFDRQPVFAGIEIVPELAVGVWCQHRFGKRLERAQAPLQRDVVLVGLAASHGGSFTPARWHEVLPVIIAAASGRPAWPGTR